MFGEDDDKKRQGQKPSGKPTNSVQGEPTEKVAILTKFGRVATVMNDQDPQRIREEVSIPPELAGERVDKAAAQLLSDYSRAELTRWLGEGS